MNNRSKVQMYPAAGHRSPGLHVAQGQVLWAGAGSGQSAPGVVRAAAHALQRASPCHHVPVAARAR